MAKSRAIKKEIVVTITTENEADLGRPAPNSLLTLTLLVIHKNTDSHCICFSDIHQL